MKSSIETEFNQTIFWLIEEIEKDLIASQQEEICFELKTNKNSPSLEDQRRAINFLEIKKAIKITSTQPFSSAARHSSVGITIPKELNIQPLIYFLVINKPQLNSISKTLYQTEPENKFISRIPLPNGCYWKGSTFTCGNKQLVFKTDSDTYKYFKLLTNQLGIPLFNQDVFKRFGCDKPGKISNGVRKSLANRIQNKSLHKRIKIVFTRDDPKVTSNQSGYTCYID